MQKVRITKKMHLSEKNNQKRTSHLVLLRLPNGLRARTTELPKIHRFSGRKEVGDSWRIEDRRPLCLVISSRGHPDPRVESQGWETEETPPSQIRSGSRNSRRNSLNQSQSSSKR